MRFENALTQDQQDQAANLVLEVAGERLALNDNTHDDNSPGWYSWNTAWLATNAASLNDATFETTLPDGADVTVRLLETSGDGNTAATGKPLIRGTPQVGQTLMARKGDMADDDDLPTTTFPTGYSFQWVRVGASNTETDINGATSQTYTATTAAVGNTIRVEVTFTDGGGTQETLESNATEAVVPAAGACPANNNWCAKLTVERSRLGTGTVYGFAHNDYGALDDKDIVHGATYQVRGLWIWDGDGGNDLVLFDFQSDRVPHGSEMNFGGTAFTASAAAEHPDHDTRYRWDRPADLAWIDGQEVTVSANLPPALESATVDGTTLVLTYVEDLDTGSTPAADAYSVTVNGTAAAPSDVSVAARTVTLIPATAVIDTDDVTVSYTRGNSPVQDVSGLDAPDFTDSAVTNNTGAVAPAPVSALVRAQGHIMILDFDEDLAQDNLPPADAFTVKADGDTVTVESVEFHVDNNALDKLRLNLPTAAIKENETVTVSYDVPTTNPLQDGDGNETMDFTDFPVTNNSTVVETRGAELTPPALEVNEGTTGSYTVVLTEAPTGSVTVTVAGASGTLLSVSPMTLVFTTSSWAVAQTVDVTTEEDANAVDETVTLTHTASGGGYDGVSLPDLEVTVADNDGGIVADPVELTVAEGGTGTYGLTLTRAPTSDVTVTVTGDAGKVTAAPSTLTFTADDWNAAQTVTVTGTQDGDKNDEAVTLRHAATGGGYTVASGDALSARVRVTVHDDETTAPGAPELDADSGYETALLRWSPPDDDGGAPVTGYEYRRGTGPAQATESLSAHTVHGLVNGTEYRFQVRAVNRIGEGAWSAAKTVTPVPLTLTVVAVSDEVVEGEPVRYRIEMSNETGWVEVGMAYRHEGEFMRSPRSSSIQGIRSRGGALAWERERATVDDTDIEAHGSFTVRLQPGAGYSVGSPWSATVRILDNDGGTLPGAPSRPSVSVVSPTMLGATWGSAAANGASVTGYELEYRAGVSGVWTRWGEAIAPGGRPVRLTGLSPGTEHEVRVRARNVRGAGPWSTTGGARTAPDPEVRVSLSAGTEVGAVEGATLEFTVRATPAPASALRVDLRVTETVEMLAGGAPTSVTVPAGQRLVAFEVRTRNDREDEGDSDVTAELRPSVRYLLGEARAATYRVFDDEADTDRGRVLRPRVETIVDPRTPEWLQARVEEPVRALRFAWGPPSDVALAHVRGWLVEWQHVERCSDPEPAVGERWYGGAFLAVGSTETLHRPPRASYFRVSALLVGAKPGPWSEPVCGEMAEFGSAQGGASEPVVLGARIGPAPGTDGAWRAGDALEAVVRFSEAVTVDTSGGTPTLAAVLGDARREAVYAGGSGTEALVFRHEVGPADDGARGARVEAGGLALNGATIRGSTGIDAELGFALAPVVTSVAVEADPDGDGLWSPGEAVTVTLGFSDAVTVRTAQGTPSVTVLAGGAREAVYSGGSGTAALRFAYEVGATQDPVRSVLVPENALKLNGGAIEGPTGLAAALAHAGAGRAGTPPPEVPEVPALSVADASAAEGATLAFAVTLDPAARDTVSVDWATADGTAKAGEDYEAGSGTLTFAPGETSKTVRVAVLADGETEDAETMGLTLSNASGAGLADARATGTVSDPPAPLGPPPAVSIADARVDEGPGAVLEFAVTLDGASQAPAAVDWETRDANARAGDDYVEGSGTLRFAPGETSKTIRVAVLDDSHDEGREVMLVVLSNPVGATIAKASAGGVIDNTDHMPQAWLGRFGRTVAEQVLDAVEDRIRSAPAAGVQVTVAGQRLGGAAPDAQAHEEAEAKARLEGLSAWLAGETEGRESRAGSRAVAPRELFTGSSFALTTKADGLGGGLVSLWGRGALTRFDGREDDLALDGEVIGALLGADWTRERWTTGLMLSHARGEGGYRGADSGEVSSTVTGLYPYGRYALSERVTVWGAAGYGAGTLTLTPEDGESYETDMDLMMAAAGLRGTVVEAPAEGGPELAVKTDALGVRTSSEAVRGSGGGNLAAAQGDVTRLRLGLEGTWRGLAIGTGTLEPRLEVGVRHDGGDAETGFGLDLGGGLAWSDPGTGIRAEMSGRGLLTHESAGFRERGIAGSFGWDPAPGSDRGPRLTLTQTMGVSASGGADALLGRRTLAGLAANDDGDELGRRRLEVRLGYGFGAFGDRFTSRPEAGFGMSDTGRDYSLVWRLVRDRRGGDIGSLEFALEARRRESANDPGAGAEPEHGIGLRMTARF